MAVANDWLVGQYVRGILSAPHDPRIERDDLMQEGRIGLLTAAEDYDPSQAAFSTFARFQIRSHCQRAFYRGTIHHPQHVQDKLPHIERKRWDGAHQTGCVLPLKDAAVAAGYSEVKAAHFAEASRLCVNELDSESTTLRAPDEADVDAAHEARERVAGILARLEPREADVICRRWGLGGREPETCREIAEDYGVTRQYVQQIERKVIARLRATTGI